jgi:predicted nucleic acid-binding protein
MVYLVDTGILLRLVDTRDPAHATVRQATRMLRTRGDQLVTAPQNIAEFWNVSTRPATARGGVGRSVEKTDRCVNFFQRIATVLLDDPEVFPEWRRLVRLHQVQGVAVHDARLVAMMNIWQISDILTMNTGDFQRYQGIVVVSPIDVLSMKP